LRAGATWGHSSASPRSVVPRFGPIGGLRFSSSRITVVAWRSRQGARRPRWYMTPPPRSARRETPRPTPLEGCRQVRLRPRRAKAGVAVLVRREGHAPDLSPLRSQRVPERRTSLSKRLIRFVAGTGSTGTEEMAQRLIASGRTLWTARHVSPGFRLEICGPQDDDCSATS
jgi:hypothetical protein